MLATLSAQAETPEWVKSIKLSGYGMTQYQYSNQQNAKGNTFNLRLLRLSLEGRVSNDFYWKAQMQINGNTSTLGSSPRLVDLFASGKSMILPASRWVSLSVRSLLTAPCILSTKVS